MNENTQVSLRDYFAAAALTGELGAQRITRWNEEACARQCYKMADEMLVARQAPSAYDQLRAQNVLKALKERKGFSHWWDQIDPAHQADILDSLRNALVV